MLFNWDIEIPPSVLDYLAVGFTFSLSYTRMYVFMIRKAVPLDRYWASQLLGTENPFITILNSLIVLPLFWIVIIPLLLIYFPFSLTIREFVVVGRWPDHKNVLAPPHFKSSHGRLASLAMMVALVPIAYLLLLLAANYLFLKPGT